MNNLPNQHISFSGVTTSNDLQMIPSNKYISSHDWLYRRLDDLEKKLHDIAYYKYVYVCGKYGQEYMMPQDNWTQHYENILNILGIAKAQKE